MTMRLRPSATIAALLCALSLSAAAEPPVAKEPSADAEKALRQRVTDYWTTRMKGDLRAIQPFYEKAFRDKYSPEVFARDFRRLTRFEPEYLGIEKLKLAAGGGKATVWTKLRTRPAILDGQELLSENEEVWLLEDGVWMKQAESVVPNI